MILYIDGHSFRYEMESLCDIFLPFEKVTIVDTLPERIEQESIFVHTKYRAHQDQVTLSVSLRIDGIERKASQEFTAAELEAIPVDHGAAIQMAVLLFRLFVEQYGYTPKWGVLIGVRPIKLLRTLTKTLGADGAADYFQNALLVSAEKTALSRQTMEMEQQILQQSRPESYSLYISIPFCPTRCAYCSFIASSVEKTKALLPGYVSLLQKEVQYTAQLAQSLHLRLETIYFGGGTPTTLSADQLSLLLDTVASSFDLSHCREITVEAGRPDTITTEKLDAMKTRGVTRISINPQTMNNAVLQRIGRHHTAEQTVEAFALARDCGMWNINMDLIAGLPGDTVDSFCQTVNQVTKMDPESITIHTLALKRSSDLNQNGRQEFHNDARSAGEMLDYAQKALTAQGYLPYYLYRQSRMVGNLENTGWAKPGYENAYNAFIMDETHTILACGAGAVSKVRDPYSARLERIFNFKYPYEYRDRFSEILERKDKVRAIYESYNLSFSG